MPRQAEGVGPSVSLAGRGRRAHTAKGASSAPSRPRPLRGAPRPRRPPRTGFEHGDALRGDGPRDARDGRLHRPDAQRRAAPREAAVDLLGDRGVVRRLRRERRGAACPAPPRGGADAARRGGVRAALRARGGGDPEVARDRGLLAALALSTMPSFLVQAYTISIDVWLVLVTTVAGWALLEAERAAGKARLRWTLLLHAMTGLGMIVKGPLTLALVFGAAVVTAAFRRDARILRPFVHPLGWLVFAAITTPWYLALDAQIPGMLRSLIERRLFGGVASALRLPPPPADHRLAADPRDVPVARDAARVDRARCARGTAGSAGRGSPLALLALAAPLLFTFSSARLVSYASPAFPWIAVLVALGAPRSAPPRGRRPRARRFGSWGRQLSATRRSRRRSSRWAASSRPRSGSAFRACRSSWRRRPPSPRSSSPCSESGPRARGAAVPRAALVGALVLLTSAAGLVGAPFAASAAKPLWDAVGARPGARRGVGRRAQLQRGLGPVPLVCARAGALLPLPFRAHDGGPAALPARPVPPARAAQGLVRVEGSPLPDDPAALPPREGSAGVARLAPRFVVAEGGEYVVLTNLPLPAERP